MDSPLSASVSAIVVVLGDDPRLHECLAALAAEVRETGLGIEVVVVENAARGEAPALPLEPAKRIRREANPGYAASAAEAIEATTGDYVLTLNPDATVHAGSVARAVAVLDSEPDVGAVAFRLVRTDGTTLDSAGIRLGPIRRARDRGMGEPAEGAFTTRDDVDAACMACALFRRSALDAARDGAGEVLDRRFFAYKEDVDLGWRLRRAGFRVAYVPDAVATHERGWKERGRQTIPLELRILSLRNRWWTILKNESALSLLLRMALYVSVEVMLVLFLLVTEPGVVRAYPRIVLGIPGTLRRRKSRPR